MITPINDINYSPITHIHGLPIIVSFIAAIIFMLLALPLNKVEFVLDFRMHDAEICCNEGQFDPIVNTISISKNGEIRWNEKRSTLADIQIYLRETTTLNPEPELHFNPAPNANYRIVIETLKMIQRSGITRLGWIGNEQHRVFEKAKPR